MLKKMKSGLNVGAALFALSALAAPIGASASEDIELNSYRIDTNDCPGCGKQLLTTEDEVLSFMSDMRAAFADGDGDDFDFSNSSNNDDDDDDDDDDDERQIVFLDFDAGGAPTFPVCTDAGTVFGIFEDHFYTEAERDAITARIRADYADFDFEIVRTPPASGEFTTLFIGQNDAPEDCSAGSNITVTATGGVSILFGAAESIDFLNSNRSDTAFADASLWEFLAQLDPSGGLFEAFSGLSVVDFDGNLLLAVSEAVTNQTANTGAHEVGHIQGLRHQNSFGAPGDGLPDTGAIAPTEFVPVFDGPSAASETVLHTMASGASVGLGLTGSTITDRFFSERSAVRLAVNEEGRVRTEERIRRRDDNRIRLRELDVPNTIIEGQNATAEIIADGIVVEGSLDFEGEADSYTFRGRAGEFFNAELISVVGRSLSFDEGILGQVRLFLVNDDGTETLVASNLQSFETVFDAEIFDAVLPETGTYRVEVSAPDEFFPADFDGDGALDPFPLSLAGAPELQTGLYSLQVYVCVKALDDDDDDDDDDENDD